MNDCVMLKGKKDRLIIQLDPAIDFSILKVRFLEKIKEAEQFIGQSKVAIEFTKRTLSEEEEAVLISIINKETKIKIAFIFGEEAVFSELPSKMIKDLTDEGVTKFHKGTLRSGSIVEYHGNLVILGDVNPGALVKAGGNVLVLGYLNGTVYAGENKNSEAFVGAFSLNPIQIKLGEIVAKNPSLNILENNKIKKTINFEVAYIKNETIYVESYDKLTIENMYKI